MKEKTLDTYFDSPTFRDVNIDISGATTQTLKADSIEKSKLFDPNTLLKSFATGGALYSAYQTNLATEDFKAKILGDYSVLDKQNKYTYMLDFFNSDEFKSKPQAYQKAYIDKYIESGAYSQDSGAYLDSQKTAIKKQMYSLFKGNDWLEGNTYREDGKTPKNLLDFTIWAKNKSNGILSDEDIVEGLGMGAALEYVDSIRMPNMTPKQITNAYNKYLSIEKELAEITDNKSEILNIGQNLVQQAFSKIQSNAEEKVYNNNLSTKERVEAARIASMNIYGDPDHIKLENYGNAIYKDEVQTQNSKDFIKNSSSWFTTQSLENIIKATGNEQLVRERFQQDVVGAIKSRNYPYLDKILAVNKHSVSSFGKILLANLIANADQNPQGLDSLMFSVNNMYEQGYGHTADGIFGDNFSIGVAAQYSIMKAIQGSSKKAALFLQEKKEKSIFPSEELNNKIFDGSSDTNIEDLGEFTDEYRYLIKTYAGDFTNINDLKIFATKVKKVFKNKISNIDDLVVYSMDGKMPNPSDYKMFKVAILNKYGIDEDDAENYYIKYYNDGSGQLFKKGSVRAIEFLPNYQKNGNTSFLDLYKSENNIIVYINNKAINNRKAELQQNQNNAIDYILEPNYDAIKKDRQKKLNKTKEHNKLHKETQKLKDEGVPENIIKLYTSEDPLERVDADFKLRDWKWKKNNGGNIK